MSDVVASTTSKPSGESSHNGNDVGWVWREVRKRIFFKIDFSHPVGDAMAAAQPITLDGDHFVVGFDASHYYLAAALATNSVRNTIENILKQASGRCIHFDVIEGTTLADWNVVRQRREKAESAVLAMAEQQAEEHHYEDVMNQIVGEIRQRATHLQDRNLPQVRAGFILDIARSLEDAREMLFDNADSHDARRSMSRMIDRIASILDIEPILLALETERCHRANKR